MAFSGKRPEGRHSAPKWETVQYRKNKFAAPVGGVFLLLMILGLIALTGFCIRFTKGMLDNTTEKQEFEKVLIPIVMFDPEPFDKPEDAAQESLLRWSLWSTILGEKRNSYQFDQLNYLTVPAADVDVTCASLFGTEIKLEHRTFEDFGSNMTYSYSPATKTYSIPVNEQSMRYTPSVRRVIKNGDIFTLEVDYIPPENAWTYGTDTLEPDKYMLYELKRDKNGYQILSIRIPSANFTEGNTSSASISETGSTAEGTSSGNASNVETPVSGAAESSSVDSENSSAESAGSSGAEAASETAESSQAAA